MRPPFAGLLLLLAVGDCRLWGQPAGVVPIPLPVVVSTGKAVPGANLQIRFTLARPLALTQGRVEIRTDLKVAGYPASVNIFGSDGGQGGEFEFFGYTTPADLKIRFGGSGVGTLPGQPFVVVTLPLLSTLPQGPLPFPVISSTTPWRDLAGYYYQPQFVTPPNLQISSGIAINGVTPGGGLLPPSFKVQITGQGFTPATRISAEGVGMLSTAFRSSQLIELEIDGPVDLTGRRFVAQTETGEQCDFYSGLAKGVQSAATGTQLILSQQSFIRSELGSGDWAVQNASPNPVNVTLNQYTTTHSGSYSTSAKLILQPWESISHQFGPALQTTASFVAEQPVRSSGQAVGTAPLAAAWPDGNPACSQDSYRAPLCWVMVQGATPETRRLSVTAIPATPLQISAPAWITASCSAPSCLDGQLTITANPAGLAPGDYPTNIQITAEDPRYVPLTVSLTFRVAESVISFRNPPPYLFFTAKDSDPPPPPVGLDVVATVDGTPFTVELGDPPYPTPPGLLVSPLQGVTPATIYVTVDPAKGNAGSKIKVRGPSNTIVELVRSNVVPSRPKAAYLTTPKPLWLLAGDPPPSPVFLDYVYSTCFGPCPDFQDSVVTVTTDNGIDWLRIASSDPTKFQFSFAVDPSALAPGTYRGTVTVQSPSHSDYAPAAASVVLHLLAGAPDLHFTPPEVNLVLHPEYPYGSALVVAGSDGSGAIPLAPVSVSTEDRIPWLIAGLDYSLNDDRLSVNVLPAGIDLPPGVYHGTVVVASPPGSSATYRLPVTLTVVPGVAWESPPGPPLPISLANSASQLVTSVAAGELLSIHGLQLGPHNALAAVAGSDGFVPSQLGGTRVLFDGVAAPILYVSDFQINVAVPYEVSGKSSTLVTVESNGLRAFTRIPVRFAAPGVFTTESTGIGQATAFNEDGGPNNATRPAGRKSVIRVLVTGLGQTTPRSITGAIETGQREVPILPITATIGGLDAPVRGVAPVLGQIAGLMQVDLVVPEGVVPGPAVPLVVLAGNIGSQTAATVAVK